MEFWRQNFVFAPENEFGRGHDGAVLCGRWFVSPPGSQFSYTYSRESRQLTPVGNRTWEKISMGSVSGSWSWSFPMDYDYLEPFLFVFDKYEFFRVHENGAEYEEYGRHRFSRTDIGVTPSFTVRRKVLNRAVGGSSDEMVELRGCICTSFNIGYNGGDSEVTVKLSGIYADEYCGDSESDYDNGGDGLGILDGLDNIIKKGNPVQFGCLSIDDANVANVLNMAVQSKNLVKLVHGVLNPVAQTYYEESTRNACSCVIQSRDPRILRQRVYTGGGRRHNTTQKEYSTPLRSMEFRSHTEDPLLQCSADFEMSDIVVKTMGWTPDDSGPLVDKLESAECREIILTVTNKIPCQYNLYYSDGKYNLDVDNPKPIVLESSKDGTVLEAVEGHLVLSRTYVG